MNPLITPSGALSHGQGDSLPFQIHLQYGDHDLLPDLQLLVWIPDKMICHLTDMNQAVMVNADVHESAEGSDIGYDSWEPHAWT